MKTESPLISVITITYNAASTLEATMKSVASQTFRDFEHIVVDGASKDDTLAIARRFEGTRILSEPDKGLYDAMNKGMRLARGKYLLFLNSGDALHTDKTLALYAERARHGDDIIFGDTIIVDADRRIICPRHLSAPQKLSFKSFASGMLICHQAFMVRKEIAPQYDLQYRFSADYDWTVKCIRAAKPDRCHNLNAITIDYLRDGLTDNNRLKSLKERYRIMCNHYGTLPTITRHIGFIFRALRRKFK